jgi:hypothetical protein
MATPVNATYKHVYKKYLEKIYTENLHAKTGTQT